MSSFMSSGLGLSAPSGSRAVSEGGGGGGGGSGGIDSSFNFGDDDGNDLDMPDLDSFLLDDLK